ncbi:MAG: protease inhibitor I42 family protein [Betaproteobacteria bacterium]|jgi:inhibitor of cysteine peptidase
MKAWIGLIAAGLVAVIFHGAGCARPARTDMAPASVVLTERQSGARTKLVVGQEVELRLDTNPSTGHSWLMLASGSPVLVPLGEPHYEPAPAPEGFVGQGGVEHRRFRAAAPGEGMLRLEYRQPWAREAPAAALVEFPVEVRTR